VITVTGPRGGCGKTVIATNLAVAMVRQDTKTALIDLNLWGGDVAMLLDVAPSRTLVDLLPGFGGIDRDVVESVISKHSSGVAVVASPVTGTFDQAALSRVIVADILKVVREQYSYTLVDSGHPNLESTLAAMDYSDLVVVVIGSDMPRLRDAKLYLRNLLIASYLKEKLRVVINRTAAAKLVSVGEMESILEFPIATEIPNDDELVSASVNLGQPVVLSAPHKPVAKALISLAESLAPQAAPANHRKRGIHWFHNLLVQMMP
jgi:pilus assembly protein CpaE